MDIISSGETSKPVESRLSVEVSPAFYTDIEALARIQWFARKKGVDDGYLPEQALGLPVGEKLSTTTDERGISYAKGEIQRFFNPVPGIRSVMLGASADGQLVGKGAMDIEKDLHRVTFHSLEVVPEFQGKGVALALREKSVQLVRDKFPSIQTVRIGRYKVSSEFAKKGHTANSFFNALRDKATVVVEDVDSGAPFEWLTIPIDVYEEEVKKRLVPSS